MGTLSRQTGHNSYRTFHEPDGTPSAFLHDALHTIRSVLFHHPQEQILLVFPLANDMDVHHMGRPQAEDEDINSQGDEYDDDFIGSIPTIS